MVVAGGSELVMERQDASNSDILEVNVEWLGWKFKLVLVYLDTRDPLWNFSSTNRVTPVSIQDGV